MSEATGYYPRALKDPKAPIDFFARRPHFIDHLAPIWSKLSPEYRGKFYVPDHLTPHALRRGVDPEGLTPQDPRSKFSIRFPAGDSPVLTAAYGDLQVVEDQTDRPLFLMEHGVGLTFDVNGATVAGYGGGRGSRRHVCLFLSPNDYIDKKTLRTYPDANTRIIGTPKMDPWANFEKLDRGDKKPIVAISFHWDGSQIGAPEAGNALDFYRNEIPKAGKDFTLMGHGHPKIIDKLKAFYGKWGIPVIEDFEDVLRIADIYVNDCSSTMYEFCVTDKPVVVLNCPAFRRRRHHGIRFWDYSDVGLAVEKREDLWPTVLSTIRNPDVRAEQRRKAVADLYPYLGTSAQRAADVMQEFLNDAR